MDWLKLGIAVVDLFAKLTTYFQQQQWYQEGKRDANAEADAEQQKRVAQANAARADADALNADPQRVLNPDRFERPD